MTARTASIERSRRIDQVRQAILDGKSTAAICLQFASQFDVTRRTVQSYLKSAREQIEESAAASRDAEYALARARLDNLYRLALEEGDKRLALSVLKEINDLAALHRPAAPQTLRVAGVDPGLVEQVIGEAEQYGVSASVVFEEFLHLIANQKAGEQ